MISGSLTLTSGTSITNNAAITAEASGLVTLDNATSISGGTITVDSGGTLTMAGTADVISGAILDNSGTFNANGTDTLTGDSISNSHIMLVSGSLTLNSGTSITNLATADTITVDSNATLTLDDTSKIVGGTITVDSGGTLTMAGTADVISGAILDNSGTFNANGTDTLTGDGISNSHIMLVSGSLTLNSGTSITNLATADTITVDSNATLTLDDTSKIVGGTITVDSGGTLTMAGSGDSIDGAALDVSGTLKMTWGRHDLGRHRYRIERRPADRQRQRRHHRGLRQRHHRQRRPARGQRRHADADGRPGHQRSSDQCDLRLADAYFRHQHHQ